MNSLIKYISIATIALTSPLLAGHPKQSEPNSLVGKKRARIQKPETPSKRVRYSKYDTVNLSQVAYWQINPNDAATLQLCDEAGNVLHTERIRTAGRKEKKLNKDGYLRIRHNKNNHLFKCYFQDTSSLEAHGFIAGSTEKAKRYHPQAMKREAECDIDAVAFWRINPDPAQAKTFQLCDANGTALQTLEVLTKQSTKRILNKGNLRIYVKDKPYFFKRDPDDDTNLEEHGFAAGSTKKAHLYSPEDFDVKAVAYWRIHLTQAKKIQLCDEAGNVLHTEKVKTFSEKERIVSRKKGYLYIYHKSRTYYFKRDPNDMKILEEHGFEAGSTAKAVRFNPKAKQADRRKLDFSAVAYWRINPDNSAELQLCDAIGNVLHTEDVLTAKTGKRCLRKGYLYIQGKKSYSFRRDPNDPADLIESGFAANTVKKPLIYAKKAKPTDRNGVNFSAVAYWRIHPKKSGILQLCDKSQNILHTEAILTRTGKKRTLKKGALRIYHNGKDHYFKRDPRDLKKLEENDFAKGMKAKCIEIEDIIINANDNSSSVDSPAEESEAETVESEDIHSDSSEHSLSMDLSSDEDSEPAKHDAFLDRANELLEETGNANLFDNFLDQSSFE